MVVINYNRYLKPKSSAILKPSSGFSTKETLDASSTRSKVRTATVHEMAAHLGSSCDPNCFTCGDRLRANHPRIEQMDHARGHSSCSLPQRSGTSATEEDRERGHLIRSFKRGSRERNIPNLPAGSSKVTNH